MKFRIVEEVKKVKPEDFGITKYKFRPDGTLDVFQNVNLGNRKLTELPFKFGKVNGIFNCSFNKLKTLKGAPEEVNGIFNCSFNKLKTLEGVPEVVNGKFSCSYNKLKSLNGLNLDGISGTIYVHGNPNLKLTEKDKLWMILNHGKIILE